MSIFCKFSFSMKNHNEISSFIWNVFDDVLRGLFKQHEYGDVILPFIVLRRMDCVLESHKDDILKVHNEYKSNFEDTSKIIETKLNLKFSNYSRHYSFFPKKTRFTDHLV